MGPSKTYMGAFLTLGSVVFAFFAIVGLGVGDCATPECALNDRHRPLWALAIIVGTLVVNVAMWFLLSRGGKTDK
ncbi:hypothetical protein ATE48_08145 [Candidatus Viadribacter manganicus]|uniref:Uncharacterized protein n=1 Tax=Candidatus Viadribacter manganicus TaxID=1759059 RepID=A0A1B1AH53_9PROT|nr:hypothetical protein ATE48_08145 [Candidatus Viadribacter manganicus]